jgi:hypothetical protein
MAKAQPSSNVLRAERYGLHQAFPIGDNEIRVVDILPGSGPKAISLKCRVISLFDCTDFEALSYVWGDACAIRTLQISGYDIEITETLYIALDHLRSSMDKRTLWVDQLCIDQSNDEEKSHQVSLMRRIYKGCSQCVIWLGDLPDHHTFSRLDAEVAVDFVKILAYGTRHGNKQDDRRHDSMRALAWLHGACGATYTHNQESRRRSSCLSPSHNETDWMEWGQEEGPLFLANNDHGRRARKAFAALIMGGNPWWSRIWTLQEASLPTQATLHWGPLTIPLRTIELAASELCNRRYQVTGSVEVAEEFKLLTSNFVYPVRGLTIARRGESPLNLLMRWRYREATDPRDKVYGLAGLLSPKDLTNIPALRDVDYGTASGELFARVTIDLMRYDSDLRALVGARELVHVTPSLPTWAIDFASSSAIGKRQTKWWNHSHRYLRWSSYKGLKFQLEHSDDYRILRLSGFFFDRVHAIGDVYHVGVEAEIDDDQVRKSIMMSRQLLQDYQASRGSNMQEEYIGGGTVKDAFARTLLGDLIMKEVPSGVVNVHDIIYFERYVELGTQTYLLESVYGMVPNHAFFITTTGYMGIGSPEMCQGDRVCIFGGGRVPFVVRSLQSQQVKQSDLGRYHLVCDAYVHGIMRGESVGLKDRQLEMIELV